MVERHNRVDPVHVCVCLYVFLFVLCVFQNCVRPITSSCMVGFENYLAQMISKIKQCVPCMNHVTRSKVKVTVHIYSLCRGILCSAHNFIQLGGIRKLFSTNDYQDKTLCPVKNHVVRSKFKFTVRTYSLCIGFIETCSCPAHNFVVVPACKA